MPGDQLDVLKLIADNHHLNKEKTWRNLSNQNVKPEYMYVKKSYYMNLNILQKL